MDIKVSIIISTYNSEEWLKKVLWGFHYQTYKNFEVIVADDGSGLPTELLIDWMDSEVFYPLIHVWQEDEGFQKTKILNKAILSSRSDYIIFTDGDCIPRNDFVETHIKNKEKGYFLSGGYSKLPLTISNLITKEDIEEQKCFSIDWLNSHNLNKKYKNKKLAAIPSQVNFLNKVTTTQATWNGHNASGWKEDILAVNGFDERMQYGGEDRELGERLTNYGIKAKQLRYSAICVHLEHERIYKNEASLLKNKQIRRQVKNTNAMWTSFGIEQEQNYLQPKLLSTL
tara:strand:+ start:268349 stop:269203 length:855 start_codon:yes stop_codon:yes gene_type:complete